MRIVDIIIITAMAIFSIFLTISLWPSFHEGGNDGGAGIIDKPEPSNPPIEYSLEYSETIKWEYHEYIEEVTSMLGEDFRTDSYFKLMNVDAIEETNDDQNFYLYGVVVIDVDMVISVDWEHSRWTIKEDNSTITNDWNNLGYSNDKVSSDGPDGSDMFAPSWAYWETIVLPGGVGKPGNYIEGKVETRKVLDETTFGNGLTPYTTSTLYDPMLQLQTPGRTVDVGDVGDTLYKNNRNIFKLDFNSSSKDVSMTSFWNDRETIPGIQV